MLRGTDQIVREEKLYHGIPDQSLHDFAEDAGKTDRPVVAWISFAALFEDRAHISSLPDV